MKMNSVNFRRVLVLAGAVASGTFASGQVSRQPVQQQVQQQVQQSATAPQQSLQPGQQPAATVQAGATQPTSLCANRPLCYEANDFVATVSEFRTSTDHYGNKVIDAMLHFVNKTNQSISLGYVEGSGSAIDDLGNRLGLNTFNGGVRGIGVVAGNNMDPKFSLPPGGGGDARFELYWSPRNQLSGVNYEMEFSIREMVRVEGNQWTLGDETLLHYQGLANGMGVAPVNGVNSVGMGSGSAAGSPVGSVVNTFVSGQSPNSAVAGQSLTAYGAQPCATANTQGTTATNVATAAGAQNQNANNAIANASAAISNLGSMFGRKKKPATNAATPASAATPCPTVPATAAVSTMTSQPGVNPAAAQPAATIPAANTRTAVVGAKPSPAIAKPPTTSAVLSQRTTASTPTQTPAAAVTKTSLKQTTPATKTAPAPVKKPTTTPAAANGSGGSN